MNVAVSYASHLVLICFDHPSAISNDFRVMTRTELKGNETANLSRRPLNRSP